MKASWNACLSLQMFRVETQNEQKNSPVSNVARQTSLGGRNTDTFLLHVISLFIKILKNFSITVTHSIILASGTVVHQCSCHFSALQRRLYLVLDIPVRKTDMQTESRKGLGRYYVKKE